MKKTEAKKLAKKLMAEHGVGDLEFTFSNTKRSLGRCFYKRSTGKAQRIDLSSYWVEHLDEDEVRDTILHEIAHALTDFSEGHGRLWKAMARKVGANPNRIAELPPEISMSFRQKHSNYRAVCVNPSCDHVAYFDRLTKNWKFGRYICGKCRSKYKIYANK